MLYVVIAALIAATSPRSETNLHPGQPRTITVTVLPSGRAYIGRDTLTIETLGHEIQQRLWKSYLGTGTMYDSIIVHMKGEVLMGVRGAALDAIKEGQDKALADLCLEKYKKTYDMLSPGEQEKLKKKFPVLFQELHW